MEPSSSRSRQGRLVVGTDGSPASAAAVRWAVEAAALVDAWLDVVLVWGPDIDFGWLTEPASRGHELVEALVDRVCDGHRPDTVRTFVMQGDPVQSLLAHAAGADVLVLGGGGAGGFLGLRLGSVTSACAICATCPVLIVPTGRAIGPALERIIPRYTPLPVPPPIETVGVPR